MNTKLIFGIILGIVLLSGCLNMELHQKVDKEGKITGYLVMNSQLFASGSYGCDQLMAQMESGENGETPGEITKCTKINETAMKFDVKEFTSSEYSTKLIEKDGKKYMEYRYDTADAPSAETYEGAEAYQTTLDLYVEMPGSIVETTGEKAGSNKVEFKSVHQGDEVYVKSSIGGGSDFTTIILIVVGIGVVLGVIWFLLLRPKQA